MFYVDASEKLIYNKGEMNVEGQTNEYHKRNILFQEGDVGKPLFAGAQAPRAGFRVVLDENEKGKDISYMLHKKSGHIMKLDREDGTYNFDLWVKTGFAGQGKP